MGQAEWETETKPTMQSTPSSPLRAALAAPLSVSPDFGRWLILVIVSLFLLRLPMSAQTAGNGAIAGQVFKPATGEYVRGAEVRLKGTDRVTITEDEGYYYIPRVAAGEAVLQVRFMGTELEEVAVTIAAGATTTRNIDLHPLGQGKKVIGSDGKEIYQLDKYVVTSGLEGSSKAIQDQRNAMGISQHVSSDEFQEQAGGNIGEYMKWLAGVDLDYVQFDARGPRLRGMDPQYANVTIDGVSIASADAFMVTTGTENTATEGSRAFGFDAVSLSSIDGIEVYKSLSADQSAGAPAGTINLRSKRAFDRKGRRIMVQGTANANTDDFHFPKKVGPGDSKHSRLGLGGTIEYSDVFLNKRLGVVVNLNSSSYFNPQFQYQLSAVNRVASTTDTRAAVPQLFSYTDSPKTTVKDTGTVTVDFKATPNLVIGVTGMMTQYLTVFDGRQFRFIAQPNTTTAASKSTVIGDDPMVELTTTSGQVQLVGGSTAKHTNSHSLTGRLDWRPLPSLTVEGRLSWSKSLNEYLGLKDGIAASTGVGAINANFTAKRSSAESSDWVFRQISGPDWGDLASYPSPQLGDEGRSDENQKYVYTLNAKYVLPFRVTSFIKVGVHRTEDYRSFRDARNWNRYNYIGPGSTAATSWGGYQSPDLVESGPLDSYFYSTTGRSPAYPGRELAAKLFNEHPEYFSQAAFQTAENYYSSFISTARDLKETIDAGYVMGYVKLKKLELQGGLRREDTADTIKGFTQRSNAEVLAAGYTLAATGRATTVPGIIYQFQSLPQNKRTGEYSDVFASASAKYSVTPDLQLQAAYYQATARPPLTQLSGSPTVNETTLVITAPNPGLLPEYSDTYSARVAYYLKRGSIAVGAFESHVENLRESFDYIGDDAVAALGFDPAVYGDYTVRSTINGSGERRFRGLEAEYRQYLTFLPKPFDRIALSANYTRLYATTRRPGMAPKQFNAGLRYDGARVGGSVNGMWTPDTPWSSTIQRYRKERMTFDANAYYRPRGNVTISLGVRNITNESTDLMELRSDRVELFQRWYFGALYTLSVGATF